MSKIKIYSELVEKLNSLPEPERKIIFADLNFLSTVNNLRSLPRIRVISYKQPSLYVYKTQENKKNYRIFLTTSEDGQSIHILDIASRREIRNKTSLSQIIHRIVEDTKDEINSREKTIVNSMKSLVKGIAVTGAAFVTHFLNRPDTLQK